MDNGWEVFKALGEPNRFQIFFKLCDCAEPTSVSEIAQETPLDQSVVSRHLKLLREAGVVAAEKRGRQILYRVNAAVLAGALRGLAALLENCKCCQTGGCCGPEKGGDTDE